MKSKILKWKVIFFNISIEFSSKDYGDFLTLLNLSFYSLF